MPKSPESKGRKRTGEGEGENTTEKIKDKSPEMRKEAKKGNEKEARKGNEKEAPKRKSVSKAKESLEGLSIVSSFNEFSPNHNSTL